MISCLNHKVWLFTKNIAINPPYKKLNYKIFIFPKIFENKYVLLSFSYCNL